MGRAEMVAEIPGVGHIGNRLRTMPSARGNAKQQRAAAPQSARVARLPVPAYCGGLHGPPALLLIRQSPAVPLPSSHGSVTAHRARARDRARQQRRTLLIEAAAQRQQFAPHAEQLLARRAQQAQHGVRLRLALRKRIHLRRTAGAGSYKRAALAAAAP